MAHRTVTFSESGRSRDVVGLIQVGEPHSPVIRLKDFRSSLVVLGAGPGCHIRIDHEHVSSRQCAFARSGTSWQVTSYDTAKNTTWVSGIPLKPGHGMDLASGVVIRVGYAGWVAVGAEHQTGQWRIAARSLDEFYLAALYAYGSARKAAEAIGMAQRTYLRAIHRLPEADAYFRREATKGVCKSIRSPFGVPIIPMTRDDL